MTQAELSATIRSELAPDPRRRARSCRICRSRASPAAAASRSSSRVRGSDWTDADRARRRRSQKQLDDSRARRRPRQRLRPRPARARDRRRTAPRASDVNVNVTDIATTVNALIGGIDGRPVLDRRPPHEHRDAPARRPAHAARGSRRCCACARPPATWCRCRAWSIDERAARSCSRSTTTTASARSGSPATSRPATRRARCSTYVAHARSARRRPATRRAVGPELAVRRRDDEPAVRADRRHPRRVHGARVAVQLAAPPDHGAHDPAAVARRRDGRAVASPARRSTCSR